MRLDMPASQATYRSWRLNNLWPGDECFAHFMSSKTSAFVKYNNTPGMSSSTIWESMKAYAFICLRGQIISYCAHQKKGEIVHLKKLTDDISHVDMLLAQTYLLTYTSRDWCYRQNLTFCQQNIQQTFSIKHVTKFMNILAHQLRQETAAQCISEINDESGIKHINNSQINQA